MRRSSNCNQNNKREMSAAPSNNSTPVNQQMPSLLTSTKSTPPPQVTTTPNFHHHHHHHGVCTSTASSSSSSSSLVKAVLFHNQQQKLSSSSSTSSLSSICSNGSLASSTMTNHKAVQNPFEESNKFRLEQSVLSPNLFHVASTSTPDRDTNSLWNIDQRAVLYPADIPTDESSLIAQYLNDHKLNKQVSAAVEAFWSQNQIIIESPSAPGGGSSALKARFALGSSGSGGGGGRLHPHRHGSTKRHGSSAMNVNSPLSNDVMYSNHLLYQHLHASGGGNDRTQSHERSSSVTALKTSSTGQHFDFKQVHNHNRHEKKDKACQTMFSIPVDFDMSKIPELAAFFINDDVRLQQHQQRDALRKMLFDPNSEESSSIASSSTASVPPQHQTPASNNITMAHKNPNATALANLPKPELFSSTDDEHPTAAAAPLPATVPKKSIASSSSDEFCWRESLDFHEDDRQFASSPRESHRFSKILHDMGDDDVHDDVFLDAGGGNKSGGGEQRRYNMPPPDLSPLVTSPKNDASPPHMHHHHTRHFHYFDTNASATAAANNDSKNHVLESPNLSPINKKHQLEKQQSSSVKRSGGIIKQQQQDINSSAMSIGGKSVIFMDVEQKEQQQNNEDSLLHVNNDTYRNSMHQQKTPLAAASTSVLSSVSSSSLLHKRRAKKDEQHQQQQQQLQQQQQPKVIESQMKNVDSTTFNQDSQDTGYQTTAGSSNNGSVNPSMAMMDLTRSSTSNLTGDIVMMMNDNNGETAEMKTKTTTALAKVATKIIFGGEKDTSAAMSLELEDEELVVRAVEDEDEGNVADFSSSEMLKAKKHESTAVKAGSSASYFNVDLLLNPNKLLSSLWSNNKPSSSQAENESSFLSTSKNLLKTSTAHNVPSSKASKCKKISTSMNVYESMRPVESSTPEKSKLLLKSRLKTNAHNDNSSASKKFFFNKSQTDTDLCKENAAKVKSSNKSSFKKSFEKLLVNNNSANDLLVKKHELDSSYVDQSLLKNKMSPSDYARKILFRAKQDLDESSKYVLSSNTSNNKKTSSVSQKTEPSTKKFLFNQKVS